MEEKDKRKVKNSSSKTVGFLNAYHHGRTKSGVLGKEENVQLFKPLCGFLIQQMTAFPFFLCPQHKIVPQFSIHPPVLEHTKVCKKVGKSSVSQDESTQKTMELNWCNHHFGDESSQFQCFLSWSLGCLSNIFSFLSTN